MLLQGCHSPDIHPAFVSDFRTAHSRLPLTDIIEGPAEEAATKRGDDHFRTDHLGTGLKERAVTGITITVGAQGLKFLIALGSTMVLARLLSPADYGLLAMVAVITGFASVLRDGGLSIATIQQSAITEEQISTLFWVNVSLGLSLTILIAVLSPVVAWFYHNPALERVTVAMAFPFLLSGLTVQHQALLQRQMRFGAVASTEVLSLALSAGFGILAAAAGWGYWSLVIMANAYSLLMLIFVVFFVRWTPQKPVRGSGVRSMLQFGGVLTMNNLFNSFGGSADKLLLGQAYAADVVGLYTRAQTLMLQPLIQFMPAVQNVVLPVLSRLADRPPRLRSVFLKLVEVTAFGCSFMTVYLVVGGDWLVAVFLGPKWAAAGTILRLLAGPAFVIPLNALCVLSLTVQGKSTPLLTWGILNNALTILAIFIGVEWGPQGVAAALTVVALFILSPLLYYITANAGPATLRDIAGSVFPAVVTGAAACLLFALLRDVANMRTPLLGLPLLFVLNCGFYFAVMAVLPSGRRALTGLREIRSTLRSVRYAPTVV